MGLPKGALGNAVKKARNDKRMTCEELAELVNVSPNHIKQIEKERKYPSVAVLFGIVDALNLSLDTVVADTGGDPKREMMSKINLALGKCSEHELSVVYATVEAMLEKEQDA